MALSDLRSGGQWISLWMDKRLNAHQEQELLEHIQQCEDCGRVASHWERLQAMLKPVVEAGERTP